MPKTLVIIPSYNERENIASLIDALLALPFDLEVLVVDDGTDGTAEIVASKGEKEPRVHCIWRGGKGGRGSAVLDGFRFARTHNFDRIVEMDADFSHDPRELSRLLEKAGDDVLVIGSRYLPGSSIRNWPLSRRVFSKCANFYANAVLQIGISDYTNGYRVYGKTALAKLDMDTIRSSGYIVLSEIAYQLFREGVSFREVPTTFVNRQRGASNFSLREARDAFTSVLRIRFQSERR
jgi:dolichol-phosphate mannosyltransferase